MTDEYDSPRLLNQLEYRALLVGRSHTVDLLPEADRVLEYAKQVWESLALKPRTLARKDIRACEKHGDSLLFFVKAYPRKQPHTVLVVVTDTSGSEFLGHILIDLAADTAECELTCPSLDFAGATTPDAMAALIERIAPDDDDPFAILESGDGTYIQTLNAGDGYVLEYQLVNTASHYETPDLVSLEQVQAAFHSYGFGDYEWLEAFEWQLQDVSELIEDPAD